MICVKLWIAKKHHLKSCKLLMIILLPAQHYLVKCKGWLIAAHDLYAFLAYSFYTKSYLSKRAFSQVHDHVELLPHGVVAPDHPVRH